jgi:release factor glutamine methyltransferase
VVTIAETITSAAASIASDTSRLDAELLLAHSLGVDRSYLFTWPDKRLAVDQLAAFNALLARRMVGEPVAHILGHQGFWSLQLAVNASTLIPRPDTEVLVETALSLCPDVALDVIDLGTGTGAIALALKAERPLWRVVASDASLDACRLAQRNAADNGLDVAIFCAHWLQGVAQNSMDVVISNPPYIDAADPHLKHGDVRFEPLSALVSEAAGTADLRSIAEQSLRVLRRGGRLLLEHGYDQREAVQQILNTLGYDEVHSVQDYGGQWRVTTGLRGG